MAPDEIVEPVDIAANGLVGFLRGSNHFHTGHSGLGCWDARNLCGGRQLSGISAHETDWQS